MTVQENYIILQSIICQY